MKKLISAISSLCLAATSLIGAFPAFEVTNAVTAKAADQLVYDLIPSGKEYESAATSGKANNIYKSSGNEQLTIDWIVKGDQGTAGMQMNFDFTQVKLVEAEKGSAYRVSPTFSDHTIAKQLKEGECVYTWAQSNALKAQDDAVIYSFKVNVPAGNGTYSVGLSKSDVNKVVPVDENSHYTFTFHGLDSVVGNGGGGTNPPPATGDKPIYDLIPSGKSYEAASSTGKAYNAYTATPGESITVDWVVQGDEGTAGMQMNFDFTQVTLVDAEKGSAYRVSPTFSDHTIAKQLKEGECVYTWAQSNALKAADGAVIYSFNIKAPTTNGTYKIGLSSSDTNKVVPVDETKPYNFTFHGLEITVNGGGSDPQPTGGNPVYDLIPSGKDYEAAEKSGKANNVYTATPGEKLTIDWIVKGDQGTAGMQIDFDFTQVDYIDGSKGPAYRVSPTYSDYQIAGKNLKKGQAVYTWAQSSELKAQDGAVIFQFNVNVPEAAGTYSVGLSQGTSKVVPLDESKPYDFTFHGLDIVVPATTETTAPPAVTEPPVVTDPPVVTESPQPTAAGYATWTIGECTVGQGGAARIPVIVTNDDGTAGFTVRFDVDSALKLDRIEWANGYSGEATINEEKQVVVWANANGSNENADGAVLYLTFNAPDNAGTYPVNFAFLDVTNTDGNKIEARTKDGSVRVDSSVAAPGGVSWTIGEAAVKPGDTARVPVQVTGDSGTAGFTVQFEADPNLRFVGFEFGSGYSGTAELNNDKMAVSWASQNGSNETANGDVLYLKFVTPAQDGTYPVSFALIDVTNTDGQELKVTRTAGYVKADSSIGGDEPPAELSVVTTYDVKFTPPTRKNYWSHDNRALKNCGGLEGMRAEMTVYKYYVNEKNEFTDVKGNTMNDAQGNPLKYVEGEEIPLSKAQAAETRTKDITELTDLSDPTVTPEQIWNGTGAEKIGNHKYRISLYYHSEKQTDEDFKISDSAVKLGDHTIFIGVKSDYNLDDKVSVDDAQSVLKYYTNYVVAGNTSYKMNDDPELDGPDGLVFYLVNVRFRKGSKPTDPMDNPQSVAADDAQCILKYYTQKDVAGLDSTTWESVVGYDLIDEFYKG